MNCSKQCCVVCMILKNAAVDIVNMLLLLWESYRHETDVVTWKSALDGGS